MKTLSMSLLVLGLFIAIIAGGFLIFGSGLISKEKKGKVLIKDQEFSVEIADNPMKQSRGLSGRATLEMNEGMLFLFSKADHQRFWMKDMLVPIDIIWIKDNKIVGVEKNVQPEPGVKRGQLGIYSPPEAVDKALEVAAGTVERLDIQVGETATVSYN